MPRGIQGLLSDGSWLGGSHRGCPTLAASAAATAAADVSFSSAELSGRKRKRGSADDSDEDVVLEEFEKREIMRVGFGCQADPDAAPTELGSLAVCCEARHLQSHVCACLLMLTVPAEQR